MLAAGLATQVALLFLWASVPGPVGAFALSPVGVLMWWLSLWLGPAANCALTRRWIRCGGPLDTARVVLWTVRACVAGTVMWIASAVVLFLLAVALV
nr:hypothetical protein [Streptomyces sp. TLI_235]